MPGELKSPLIVHCSSYIGKLFNTVKALLHPAKARGIPLLYHSDEKFDY